MHLASSNQSIVYIGIGSNLGDRVMYLGNAVKAIKQLGDSIALSSVYETEPFGVDDVQPMYLNMVMAISTNLGQGDLLSEMLKIEQSNGRIRNCPNEARTLDLDILMFDDEVIQTPGLIVPHPRMHKRAFVMLPLAEIAPDVLHPQLRLTVSEIASDLQRQNVIRIGSIDDLS